MGREDATTERRIFAVLFVVLVVVPRRDIDVVDFPPPPSPIIAVRRRCDVLLLECIALMFDLFSTISISLSRLLLPPSIRSSLFVVGAVW